jgi:DNA-binding NarL/FixJ family response regulator
MKTKQHASFNILLADDDVDDYTFFNEALKDYAIPTKLNWVHDGEKLMQELINETKELPVIIYSTSFHKVIADKLHKNGANYYISKPSEISELKKAVQKMITLVVEENVAQPAIENFVLTEERKNYKTQFWFSNFFRLPFSSNFN